MNAHELIESYSNLIDRRLGDYVQEVVRRAAGYHSFIASVYETLGEFLLRKGKRIASCSTLLTYEGYNGSVDSEILDVCVAVEFYRHSILIHDDLVDGDKYRRGGLTIHTLYAEDHNQRFGEALALFCGNLLFSQALAVLWGTRFQRDSLFRASQLLTEDYLAVNESQILDLLFEYKTPTVEEWRVMASKRAASLFKATMGIGALLAGAPERDIKKVREAASHIGYAFDIQDDLIGTFASEEQYGRPLGGDILLGKKPLHIVYVYEMASKDELKELEDALKARSLDKGVIEIVRRVVKRCGALERAERTLKEEALNGIKLLDDTSMLPEGKKRLREMVKFVTESFDWYK
ncbi:MAG: polyprenyl synthetase family protein [Candidatus Bathyarchaeia archaeon]